MTAAALHSLSGSSSCEGSVSPVWQRAHLDAHHKHPGQQFPLSQPRESPLLHALHLWFRLWAWQQWSFQHGTWLSLKEAMGKRSSTLQEPRSGAEAKPAALHQQGEAWEAALEASPASSGIWPCWQESVVHNAEGNRTLGSKALSRSSVLQENIAKATKTPAPPLLYEGLTFTHQCLNLHPLEGRADPLPRSSWRPQQQRSLPWECSILENSTAAWSHRNTILKGLHWPLSANNTKDRQYTEATRRKLLNPDTWTYCTAPR